MSERGLESLRGIVGLLRNAPFGLAPIESLNVEDRRHLPFTERDRTQGEAEALEAMALAYWRPRMGPGRFADPRIAPFPTVQEFFGQQAVGLMAGRR